MNVFITGGSTGIGKTVGGFFVKADGKVGVCGFQTLNEIENLPEGFHYYQADVTNEDAMIMAVNQFVSECGSIDVMIANAGLNMLKTLIPDTKRGKHQLSKYASRLRF